MDSGMISKIQKSKRYAEEPERIEIKQFDALFHGEHAEHHVTYEEGTWTCDCDFFQHRGVCSHTMTFERLMEPMLSHHREEQVAE